jgi:hypothetical protein
MTRQRQPWESPEEPETRDVFAAEMVGDPGPDGLNPVSSEIASWVSSVIEALRARIRKRPDQEAKEPAARGSVLAGAATATALGALEGTLKGKSLDGELKEAQILDAYATARQKNADAEKLEAETALIRQEAAFDRLERTVALLERLGTPVNLAMTASGQLAIVVGEQLVAEFPELTAEGALPHLLRSSAPDTASEDSAPSTPMPRDNAPDENVR